jgi:hypothetical protein
MHRADSSLCHHDGLVLQRGRTVLLSFSAPDLSSLDASGQLQTERLLFRSRTAMDQFCCPARNGGLPIADASRDGDASRLI